MKMNGKIIEGPVPEVIVIPKGENEFVFKALPVLDFAPFEELCKTPVAPTIVKKGGETFPDFDDKGYNEALTAWAKKKNAWTVITSLKATDDLEWETVVEGDPETWPNYLTELQKIFADAEVSLILDIVYIANGVNQKKIDDATKRFLAGQGQDQNT